MVLTGTIEGDPGASSRMIVNETFTTSASISAGSNVLAANSTASIENLRVGDIIYVPGAGPMFDGLRMVHYGQVVEIIGTSVILDVPAVATVTNASVVWGASDITIQGSGTLDGNGTHSGIAFLAANNCTVTDITANSTTHGAILFGFGSRNGRVTGVTMNDNGDNSGPSPLGAAIWLFGSCHSCVIEDVVIAGGTNGTYGVIIDDRSVTADTRDGSCSDNIVRRVSVDQAAGGGIIVHGSDDNLIEDCVVTGPSPSGTGISIDGSTQGTTELRSASRNTVTGCTVSGQYAGLWIGRFGTTTETTYTGNTITGNTFDVIDGET